MVKLHFEFAGHKEGQGTEVEVSGVGDVVDDGALPDALFRAPGGSLSALAEEQQYGAGE